MRQSRIYSSVNASIIIPITTRIGNKTNVIANAGISTKIAPIPKIIHIIVYKKSII